MFAKASEVQGLAPGGEWNQQLLLLAPMISLGRILWPSPACGARRPACPGPRAPSRKCGAPSC
eukprot:9079197-Pyramimonas_sp.AAC.1